MKIKKQSTPSYKAPPTEVVDSGQDFETLMLRIPTTVFVQMVGKSGLPTPEARELCAAFKGLKGE